MLPRHGRRLFLGAMLTLAGPCAAVAAEPEPVPAGEAPAESEGAATDDVISLAAYNVKSDRIEDFGLRVASARYPGSPRQPTSLTTVWFAKYAPEVTAVVPNTAATRAGLQPGDRILKSEGRSTIGGPFSRNQWDKLQQRKWAEVAGGKRNVTWTLEVETPATKLVRTVKLVIPTPPPHWGASIWHGPEGRSPSTVVEAGPLAERSRAVLDNGIWTLLDWPFASVMGDNITPRSEPTGTGYAWELGNFREGSHRIIVTQLRGHTRVFLETASPATDRRIYLTSPSGVLEKAWRWNRQANIAVMRAKPEIAAKAGEISLEEARVGFEHELDLWTTKVEKVSARWPFEVKPGYDADAIFAVLAPPGTARAAAVRPFAADFLKLPPATEAQQAIFSEAYRKLGTEQDRWAYTETSHGLENTRVTVTRFDPSQPEAKRSMLLSVDGKTPTAADVQRWRDDGGDVPKALGDIPPLAGIVDLKQLRVAQEEATALVFELPIRNDSETFPTDKFQALFRVNKAGQSFEDITVKLRDSFRIAGVVKVTEAGLQARWQTLDPAYPPQPVFLKGGGGARILLVKISRDFETTRADFRRVDPYVEPESVGPEAVAPSGAISLPGSR